MPGITKSKILRVLLCISLIVVNSFSNTLHAATPDSQSATCPEVPLLERKLLDKVLEISKLGASLKEKDGKIVTLQNIVELYSTNQTLFETAAKNRVGIIETQQKIIQDLEASVNRRWYEHPALWTVIGISLTLAVVAVVANGNLLGAGVTK